MPFPYDVDDVAAIARLGTLYNGSDYDAATNAGGFGEGGHQVNFIPSLQDVATAAEAVSAAATSAGTSATSAAASAAKLQGTSTTSLDISAGTKTFTTQSGKFFDAGTFVFIVSAAAPTTRYMAGQVASYSGTTLVVNASVVLGSGTYADWIIYSSSPPGAKGTTGDTGPMGVTPNYQFTFSTTTTDSDPGTGVIRQNNAAAASTTSLFVDNLERNGSSITAWLDSFDDSTTTALRGTITIVQLSDPTKIAVFNVTGGVTDGTGYRKIAVTYVSGPGGFTNGAILTMGFTRTGNAGLDGIGAGDVVGPSSATDDRVALFSGSTGKLLKEGPALANVASSGAAADVTYAPAGSVSATSVQAAITELDTEKAPLASPGFTGTPTAPTATTGTNTTQIATTAFVKAAVDALIASAPGALDTLDELAAALGDDANFSTTVLTALANRLRIDAAQSLSSGEQRQGLANLGIDGAWITGPTTIVSGGGTLTSATCVSEYMKIGRTVFYHAKIVITTNGTGSTSLQVVLPFTAAKDSFIGGRENQATGAAVTGAVVGGTSTLAFQRYDGVYPGADGRTFVLNGTYEATS